jgi:5-methylcytosine-specific restriction protein A
MTVRILRPEPQPYRDTKTPEERRFYSSYRWQLIRKHHRSEEPFCRECKAQGVIQVAECVDHIVPIREGGSPYDPANLQSLCQPCHNKKRRMEKPAGR